MKYLGNYKNWVKQVILDTVMNNEGEVRPGKEESEKARAQGKDYQGIDVPGAKWRFYYEEIGINDIELPIPYTGTIDWWFVRLDPACLFPMHVDTFKDNGCNVRRLWIPYQDYITGHVFVYKDKLISDYQAGDIFEFDDPTALHGSANLTFIPKVSLQITIYDV